MNKEEKINTLKNMLNCYLHVTNLTSKEMEENEKFTDELIEDICNTRCCETLPCSYAEGYNDAIAKIKEEAKYIDKQ